MDFEFTPEQQQLADTVARVMQRDYSFKQRNLIKDTPTGWSREFWKTLADVGLLAINVPEQHGGLDAGAVETLLVMNAIGRSLVLEPYCGSAVLATSLLRLAARAEMQAELLPDMAAGNCIVIVAHEEAGARYQLAHVCTRAIAQTENLAKEASYLLNGHKTVVYHAAAADKLIVTARTAGSEGDPDGISLFLLDRNTVGLRLREYATLDGQRAAEVFLENVVLPADRLIGCAGQGYPALHQAWHIGIAASCAEAVGAMQALFDLTVEYLKTRRQFGVPISQFQVLKHRAVDMLMHLEQAKSMSYLAAIRCTAQDPQERQRALAAAKVTINDACRFIGQNALQLHGAIGMSDETIVSHYFKRLLAIATIFGDTPHALQQFIAATHPDRPQ